MVYKQNVRNIEDKFNRLHKINLIIRNFTYYVVCILYTRINIYLVHI